MNLKAEYQTSLDALDSALHHAREPTLDLLAKIISGACTRARHCAKGEKFDRLMHFARIGAWTEAAFALIELELPQWQLRRIAYDGGEWHCALSRHRELPDWLDQSIETHHTDLALALLTALMEAQQLAPASSRPSVPPAPRAEAFVAPLCCDNFA